MLNECLQAYLRLRPAGPLGQDGSGGCRGGAGRLRSQEYGGGYHGGAAGHLVQGAGHAGDRDDQVGDAYNFFCFPHYINYFSLFLHFVLQNLIMLRKLILTDG